MSLNVEIIGNQRVTKLPNGMYSVVLTNGNMGAYVTDEAGVLELKEKYANKGDTFVSGKNDSYKPLLTYEDAKKVIELHRMGILDDEKYTNVVNEALFVIRETERKKSYKYPFSYGYLKKNNGSEIAETSVLAEKPTAKSEMTYEEAKKIILLGTGKWGKEAWSEYRKAWDVVRRTETENLKKGLTDPNFLISPTWSLIS